MMAVASRLEAFLAARNVPYDLLSHPRTESSSRTAQAAHIPGSCLAKSVVVQRGGDYAVAVIPSTHRIELGSMKEQLGSEVSLATEAEIGRLFEDCELGAVPPIGAAYGLPVLLDESLADAGEVYFEGGDHTTLVHMSGEQFRELMTDARLGRFSHRM
jgi:Ala-tRNA(Pro) deacylase